MLTLMLHAALAADPAVVGSSTDLPFTPPQDPTTPQIVNGAAADKDLYPETGGILFGGTVTANSPLGGGSQTASIRSVICSSTLIAPDVVIAAAHCVDEDVISQGGSVEGGEFRWSRKADLTSPATPFDPWPNDAVKVLSTHVPPGWDINALNDMSLGGQKFDISLLFLEEPVLDVKPAVLTTEAESADLAPGDTVDIVGWGLQKPASILDMFSPPEPGTSGEKRWGTTTLGEVGEFEFQVGDGDQPRKCKGDSGGPTFMPIEGTVETYRLIGVTSRSSDFTLCAETGGFDTRVSAYLNWIDKTMRAGCEDGTRSWCDEAGVIGATPLPEEEAQRGCDTSRGGSASLFAVAMLALRRRRRA
jgi:hypothetical protein